MEKKKLLLSKIDRAKTDVTEAEADLERLIRELSATPRAEKTTVSRVVEDAFGKLRAAKSDLAELEKLIETDAK